MEGVSVFIYPYLSEGIPALDEAKGLIFFNFNLLIFIIIRIIQFKNDQMFLWALYSQY